MWEKFKKILGYAWASPVTLAGLVYAGMFSICGFYEWKGVRGDGLVWMISPTAPHWVVNMWKGWAGHAIGNVVVLVQDPGNEMSQVLVHELKHVDQCMRLGIFQPIIYGICALAIKLGCPGSDPYLDCIFEIDARRAAGQKVDLSKK